jgi:hypothetical protein
MEQVQNIEALGKLDDKLLLTTIRKGAGRTSGAELARTFMLLSNVSNRVSALLESTGSAKLVESARARAQAVRKNLAASRQVLPPGEFATALGITRQALSKAVQANRVFVLPVGAENYYPAFYSDSALERRKLERVSKLLGDLSGWEKWRFFTNPKGSLARLTPLEALKKGKYKEVLTAASGFAER